ncbi:XF1762 family protein [Haloarcula sp. Atlit-7R]|uniref:XF1762 family protein n=1 Tax=Haloarcula sp. Atlit-7R TaxID=2282125 RepID=UPI000F235683|nr:XF1762 family protein [Haloarcula sp. Atlit-7R]RLM94306.1 hypothetical protein D3D01_15700 [Haloarcula sp. Atlit-7R]
MEIKTHQQTLIEAGKTNGEPDGPNETLPPAPSVDDLTLIRERSKKPVDLFLEEHHYLGSIQGWKACFGARYQGHLVAVCVLGRPANPDVDDGTNIYITRLAARPDRPQNTGSWLIARAREWAALEDYDTIIALAGIAGNPGTVYRAAGFTCENFENPDIGGGDSWQSREGRQAYEEYNKRRWTCDLKNYR